MPFDSAARLLPSVFYLDPTTDGTVEWMSTSFHAWLSRDLVRWSDEGVILDLPRDLAWAKVRAWAPAIVAKNGRYYYHFSADKNVGVAVADRPEGPFSDPLGRSLVAKDDYPGMQCIDPMVFVDDDGSAYLCWGQGRCKVVRLNDDMISFNPSVVRDITPTGYTEGPFVHKCRDTYYLSWSEFDTRDPRYSVAYGTADKTLGPFKKARDDPVLQQSGIVKGAGHHSIVQIPARDEWVIAYHRLRIPGGNGYNRETCLSPLRHAADGTIRPVDVFASVGPVEPKGVERPVGSGSSATLPEDFSANGAGRTVALSGALAWPEDRRLTVRSLASGSAETGAVSLLGHDGTLKWQQATEGLHATLLGTPPCEYAFALKVTRPDRN